MTGFARERRLWQQRNARHGHLLQIARSPSLANRNPSADNASPVALTHSTVRAIATVYNGSENAIRQQPHGGWNALPPGAYSRNA